MPSSASLKISRPLQIFSTLIFFVAVIEILSGHISPAQTYGQYFRGQKQVKYVKHLSAPPRLAVIESKGCHDEVTAAVLAGLGGITDIHVDAFLQQRRFGIQTIFDAVISRTQADYHPLRNFTKQYIQEGKPDVVISITTAYDLVNRDLAAGYEHLFSHSSAHLYLVMHHPADVSGERYRSMFNAWIKAGRLRFITLSPHVSEYMRNHLLPLFESWTSDRELVVDFPPVFQIEALLLGEIGPVVEKQWFTIQGDLVKPRGANRDWKGTFEQLEKVLRDTKSPDMELHLIGDGNVPPVPEHIKEKVKFDTSLPYVDFYQYMHKSTAILPAFAHRRYLTEIASSTIAAAMIAGTPLIADRELVSAYSFLEEEDVYLKENNESELDAAVRVSQLPEQVRRSKSAHVQRKNAKLYQTGIRSFATWLEKDLGR